jgi:hypothetical protein
MAVDFNTRSIDDIPEMNFSPYRLLDKSPENIRFRILPMYRIIRGIILIRLIPLLNIALIFVVLYFMKPGEWSNAMIFYMVVLCITPFIFLMQYVCTELEFAPGLIRRKTMYGLYAKIKEHQISPGDHIEVQSTRGRARAWVFYLKQGETRTSLFFVPGATILFNTSKMEESKRNFMETMSGYLKVPVKDIDGPNR